MEKQNHGSPKIFFSYSRTDGEQHALRLANDLRHAGANVWIDQLDIGPGKMWDLEVEKALNEATCVLFIATEKSTGSNNVLDEVYYALEQNKQVIPLVFHPCRIPFRLARLQRVDFTQEYRAGFQRLLKALGLQGEQPAATPLSGNQNNNDDQAAAPPAGATPQPYSHVVTADNEASFTGNTPQPPGSKNQKVLLLSLAGVLAVLIGWFIWQGSNKDIEPKTLGMQSPGVTIQQKPADTARNPPAQPDGTAFLPANDSSESKPDTVRKTPSTGSGKAPAATGNNDRLTNKPDLTEKPAGLKQLQLKPLNNAVSSAIVTEPKPIDILGRLTLKVFVNNRDQREGKVAYTYSLTGDATYLDQITEVQYQRNSETAKEFVNKRVFVSQNRNANFSYKFYQESVIPTVYVSIRLKDGRKSRPLLMNVQP